MFLYLLNVARMQMGSRDLHMYNVNYVPFFVFLFYFIFLMHEARTYRIVVRSVHSNRHQAATQCVRKNKLIRMLFSSEY